jgi:predicted AlkP superfamily phosphohydrolase/phosphomutase
MAGSSRRRLAVALALLSGAGLAFSGCAPRAPERVRLLVIGIDGGDWEAIEELWRRGRLPQLRALAERGVATRLGSAYGKSPVIWTTMATGVGPDRHGIDDFVVATDRGDLPVSSSLRRVPALWSMLSSAGLRTGVVSWWATWPAEEIAGAVLSDRAVSGSGLAPVGRRASPESLDASLADWLERALADRDLGFDRVGVGARDRLSVMLGRHWVEREDLDLALVYLRSIDVVSHLQWKYFEPDRFGIPEAERARAGDPVAEVYEATDRAIGLLVESAGPEWDVLVVSDHGFAPMAPEQLRVQLDFDRVLERLGFLRRGAAGGVDVASSRVYTHSSWAGEQVKRLRRGGVAGATLRDDLAAALARVRWGDGAETFRVREPRARERRAGADLVVRVLHPQTSERLTLDGEGLDGVIGLISRQSGTHHRDTPGVLFAAGPHVDPAASLDGVRIHDFAPTVLWALGLPVAEDFVGVARRDLFTEELRRRRPELTIASWGERESGAPDESAIDQEILDGLRALGYLDR